MCCAWVWLGVMMLFSRVRVRMCCSSFSLLQRLFSLQVPTKSLILLGLIQATTTTTSTGTANWSVHLNFLRGF